MKMNKEFQMASEMEMANKLISANEIAFPLERQDGDWTQMRRSMLHPRLMTAKVTFLHEATAAILEVANVALFDQNPWQVWYAPVDLSARRVIGFRMWFGWWVDK